MNDLPFLTKGIIFLSTKSDLAERNSKVSVILEISLLLFSKISLIHSDKLVPPGSLYN